MESERDKLLTYAAKDMKQDQRHQEENIPHLASPKGDQRLWSQTSDFQAQLCTAPSAYV